MSLIGAMSDSLSTYLLLRHDAILKADAEEKGALLIHNNPDLGTGAVLSQGALKLVKKCTLQEEALTLQQAIEEVASELGIGPPEVPNYSTAVLTFLQDNPVFEMSSKKPTLSPLRTEDIILPTTLILPGGPHLQTESGRVTSRSINEKSLQYNTTSARLPKDFIPILRDPIMFGSPKPDPRGFSVRETLDQINPHLRAREDGRGMFIEGVSYSECGACGVCGACVFCGEINYGVAVLSTTATLALFS
jgi:hypothetical protein